MEEAARVPPHFGVVPNCSTAQSVASADPYFDIEKEYDDAEPVCICGICDDVAVEAGAALPLRRADTNVSHHHTNVSHHRLLVVLLSQDHSLQTVMLRQENMMM